MTWIRANLLAVVVLVAVAASFVLGRIDTEAGQDAARADNVVICQLGNERGALVAAYQRRTADARRASGDIAIAEDYDAFARGSEANLAVAKYIENPQEAAQVVKVRSDNGPLYQLTDNAKELILRGCERALRD